ncbi:MAG: RagB/SusD family nutrient uptake outer membrane protein [Bacteroidales bacterium]|nr:RagB/SusD family nutrient uptake outer membrane protein [Bacteroidales bacterium]
MRTLKFALSLLSLTLVFTSCEKFLDVKPESNGIAIENAAGDSVLYKSASEVEAALAGAYADFKNEYYQLDYYVNGDAQSDDAYAGADNPANFQIDDYKIDALNSNVSRDWAYLYGHIGKCNSVINNVDKCPDPSLTAERKKQIKAEALFIRAFQYFQAVQLWGDVPLQLTEVKTISAANLPEIYNILYPPRASMDEVFKQIISDLEKAAEGVPVTAAHKGLATKGAVYTLLAKVYATQDPHDWNKVLEYCNKVIDLGIYQLLPDYDMLWNNSQENSVESIFEINYSGGSSDGNWGTKMFRGLDWKKFNIPSNDLVKAFQQEGDQIRFNSSIYWGDVTGRWSDPHWPQNHYPFINKWRNFQEGSDQNYIIYRLADVLLLKAEALNELGDLAGAAALVNQIRARVNLPAITASNQAEMRLAIEKERRLELAFEGHRWYDLKRTGRAIEVINNVKGENDIPLGYQLNENRLLWPIPQAELDKNTKLTQNPGY